MNKLTPVEIAQLKAETFSPAVACEIVGITAERLLTWHKLNLIPEPRTKLGKGNRRRYNFYQLAFLVSLRVLSKRGVSLHNAKKITEDELADRIAQAFDDVCAEGPDYLHPVDLMIYDLAEDEGRESIHHEVLFNGRPIGPAEPEFNPDPTDIREWMNDHSINDGVLIHIGGLARGLQYLMEANIDARRPKRGAP